MNNQTGKVMVVGGGIAGLTAAWELSRQNINVELVEKSCFLGGHSIGFTCKATDKCQQCGACSVEQMLANVVNEPLINVHLRTEVKKMEKSAGFKALLVKSSLDTDTPEVLTGFSRHNSPLYVETSQTMEGTPEGVENIANMGTEAEIVIDAVILATGYSPFDPEQKSTYGYGKWENVITGMELENMLREKSILVRPSDGKVPEKIAFIQCVGSRDERLGHLWCSEVCCAYAMRMAANIKFNSQDTEISIFYIDIQNTGKEFPLFYEKIKSDVRFVRTIPVDIYPLENARLELRHMAEDEGTPASEEYDLVVLSVGIMPGADTAGISEIFDIPVNEDGFLDNKINQGVFVAGTAAGPGSIADTIADSGKRAYDVIQYLGVIK
ncbi:MAG: FAD-dependent oxidoreductase [Thermodesulfobacteriota bacterium]|nr:FAD-dependent oxidoreductase [Thermodesulfobacteriota bacterium]